jgi:hypothetical protein
MKVFLSHATEDSQTAAGICQALRGAGHTVFFDADDLPPGGDYHTRIRDAIALSDAFVFVLSPQAQKPGKYTLSELKFAKQRWERPAGHVLPVMIEPVEWKLIDPWLASVTVLRPSGNAATETADALAHLAESAEAKAATARWRSPLFAAQLVAALMLAVAWSTTVMLLGWDARLSRRASLVVLAVAALAATTVLGLGAARRARDPAIRTLREGYAAVLAGPGFAAASACAAVAAAAALFWPLAAVNRVSFVAEQDVELLLADQPVAVLRAGTPTLAVLPVGRCSLAYRLVGARSEEIGVLDPLDVPRWWGTKRLGTITVPKIESFGKMREDGSRP